jgi:hypothetical protein
MLQFNYKVFEFVCDVRCAFCVPSIANGECKPSITGHVTVENFFCSKQEVHCDFQDIAINKPEEDHAVVTYLWHSFSSSDIFTFFRRPSGVKRSLP